MTARHSRKPWQVVAQTGGKPDVEQCRHRFEWTADVHAVWLSTRGSSNVTGVFYTVYRADGQTAS